MFHCFAKEQHQNAGYLIRSGRYSGYLGYDCEMTPINSILTYFSSRYDLMQFSEVVEAVKAGNLLSLNEALDKNEKFFIKNGIFLILEKLKVITYRLAAECIN